MADITPSNLSLVHAESQDSNPFFGMLCGVIFMAVLVLMIWGVYWAGTHRNVWALLLSMALAFVTGFVVVRAMKDDDSTPLVELKRRAWKE